MVFMDLIWVYSIVSVVLVSLISLVGIFFLSFKKPLLKKILIYMVGFAAGALFGDAFIHLLPESTEEAGFTLAIAIYVLLGIVISFIIEKLIRCSDCKIPLVRHIHHHASKHHQHHHVEPFAIMNLLGDFIHNFIDGLIIGASYLVSIPVGIATTLAVLLHELPQELGDFGILVHGGFTQKKALFFNFITALSAVLGVLFVLTLGQQVEGLTRFLIPFAAGSFIYIAGSDLIPELHREDTWVKSAVQVIFFLAGIFIMALLLFIE